MSPNTTSRCCALTLIAFLGCGPAPKNEERIELEAIAAIDFTKLDDSIKTFLQLAEKREVVGKPASDFQDVIKVCLTSDEDDSRIINYIYLLPENEVNDLDREDLSCWPQVLIRVNRETDTIFEVFVNRQCF